MRFSFKKQAPVFITLLVIISLGLAYLFIYIPHNEKIIQEQRFRVLQNIDENIHRKIENSVALLNNLLKAYEEPPEIKENKKIKPDVINEYIKNSPQIILASFHISIMGEIA